MINYGRGVLGDESRWSKNVKMNSGELASEDKEKKKVRGEGTLNATVMVGVCRQF